jgi:putative intracellular protease/amidase
LQERKVSDTQDKAAKHILILASNAAVSPTTGWPIGFWWAELTHPFFEFHEAGYAIEIVSPKGGDLIADGYSDPEDASAYAADDFVSLGFKQSPKFAALLKGTRSIKGLSPDDYDAILVIGGQGPMVTMIDDAAVHALVVAFHAAGKVTALICHGTCVLLKARGADGELLCKGKTWTGFADSEEAYADAYAGQKIQPFWIGEEARKIADTNYVSGPRFAPFAVRDGHLITGQQQFSGRAAAKLMIEALGR